MKEKYVTIHLIVRDRLGNRVYSESTNDLDVLEGSLLPEAKEHFKRVEASDAENREKNG